MTGCCHFSIAFVRAFRSGRARGRRTTGRKAASLSRTALGTEVTRYGCLEREKPPDLLFRDPDGAYLLPVAVTVEGVNDGAQCSGLMTSMLSCSMSYSGRVFLR
jgi:hypothetical protein